MKRIVELGSPLTINTFELLYFFWYTFKLFSGNFFQYTFFGKLFSEGIYTFSNQRYLIYIIKMCTKKGVSKKVVQKKCTEKSCPKKV